MISEYCDYHSERGWRGQFEILQIIMQRATIRGFLVLDHPDRFPEAIEHLAGLLAAGKLTYQETVVDGLEHARTALNQLFQGENTGKMIVKVADPAHRPAVAGTASAGAPAS
jgi:NADPH2:quinone reductase